MLIHVYLISDFGLILDGISALFQSEDQKSIKLIGVHASIEQAIEEIRKVLIDVVLLDIDSTSNDEVLMLISKLKTISKAKILLLTRLRNIELQDKAIIEGARGVLRKDTSARQLFTALRKVVEGEIWLDRAATGRLFVEFSRLKSESENFIPNKMELLTSREREIISHVINSNKATKVIANDIQISESTLRNHLSTIYKKLGVTNRRGLITYAFEKKMINKYQHK